MRNAVKLVQKLGHCCRYDRVWRLGFATRFLFALLMYSGASFRRASLTLARNIFQRRYVIADHYGFWFICWHECLGYRVGETLQRFASTEALGVMVALTSS